MLGITHLLSSKNGISTCEKPAFIVTQSVWPKSSQRCWESGLQTHLETLWDQQNEPQNRKHNHKKNTRNFSWFGRQNSTYVHEAQWEILTVQWQGNNDKVTEDIKVTFNLSTHHDSLLSYICKALSLISHISDI